MFSSLIAARPHIQNLVVEHLEGRNYEWDLDYDYPSSVGSRSMVRILFQPICSKYATRRTVCVTGEEIGVGTSSAIAISSLLRAYAGNLRSLTVSKSPASGRLFARMSMPFLEQLRCSFMGLDMTSLARLIREARCLASLHLDGLHAQQGNWKDVLDAIRCHAQRMELVFVGLINDSNGMTLYLVHHQDLRKGEEPEPAPETRERIHLAMYLSNRCEWNEALQAMFE